MARRRPEKLTSQPGQNNEKSGLFRTKTVIMSSCLVVAVCIGFKGYLETRVNTRFNNIRMVEKSGLQVPDRYWGSYRPGVYFGMKTREPYSIVSGLMWYFPRLLKSNGDGIRHWCEQADNLKHYTWMEHDGRNFGIQEIADGPFHLKTSFVKRIGGVHGGDWTARVTVTTKDKKVINEHVTLIWYVALEEKAEGWILPNGMGVKGETNNLGGFKFQLFNRTGSILSESYLSTAAPGLHLLKETVINSLRIVTEKNVQKLVLPGDVLRATDGTVASPNFIALQVTARLPFDVEFLYESDSFHDRPNRLFQSAYDDELKKYSELFNDKYEATFQLTKKGWNEAEVNFGKAALSNMLGGIGYFYGASRVSSSYTEGTVPYWKAPLYTAVPSRSFFPRGFLWDEAFHGILISTWDLDIQLDIMHHWFDLMNIEGWIPREQILGIEALSKVPEEFVTQFNTNANPPVFFLTLQHIVRNFGTSLRQRGQLDALDRMFDRLEAWYDWFNTTQRGNLPTTYRWRGRDALANELNPKTLTSGLDDFPRASHPTDDERHVDLRCWMAMASSALAQLATLLDRDGSRFTAAADVLAEPSLLFKLHWSEQKKQFADYGLHSDAIVLKRPHSAHRYSDAGQQQQMVRVVLQEPTLRFIDSHFGYVNIFPFLLQILPANSPQLGYILGNLSDTNLLWSEFGLRSLARTSNIYNRYNTEHDPPYWRGAIWINMNYLAVKALHYYSLENGPYQQRAQSLYHTLRNNLISNVINEYKKTGYIWEHYSDETGEGKGCRPFTGWSALTVLMMAEVY